MEAACQKGKCSGHCSLKPQHVYAHHMHKSFKTLYMSISTVSCQSDDLRYETDSPKWLHAGGW